MNSIDPPEPRDALLDRWQRTGDRDALDHLLRAQILELKQRVLRRAQGILRSPASASDVVQEAVLRVLQQESLPRFRSEEGLRAYLWRAAERLLIDRLRRRHSQPLSLDADVMDDYAQTPASAESLGANERREVARDLRVCLELLANDARSVLELALLEQQSHAQIGARLGISAHAAKMRVLRAKRHLVSKLERWNGIIN